MHFYTAGHLPKGIEVAMDGVEPKIECELNLLRFLPSPEANNYKEHSQCHAES